MRILILFNDYLEVGGERHSVATEVRALIAAGHEVSLLTVTNDSLRSSLFARLDTILPSMESYKLVAEEIIRFRPDIVHAENLFPRFGAGAILAIRESKVPWVRTLRNYRRGCIAGTFIREGMPCTDCSHANFRLPGIQHSCYRDGRMASIAATANGAWDRLAEKFDPPDAYIAVSGFVAHRLVYETLRAPVHVVHNASPEPSFELPNMQMRTIDCLFVGRLSEEKGIRVFLELAAYFPCLKFAIAGSGQLESEVITAAEKLPNLEYLGILDPLNVSRSMADSRLILVPSDWDEPFGRVAAEALAHGALPLVASRGGLPEIVERLPYDAVCDNSFDAWSAGISNLLAAPEMKIDGYSKVAKEIWNDQFSEESLAAALTKIYNNIINAR